MNKRLSRRDFLKLAGITSTGLALSACGVKATDLPITTFVSPTETIIPTETPTPTSTPKPPETLREYADALGIEIGVMLDPDSLSRKLQQEQFNLGVANFSWNRREPQRGARDFKYIETVLTEAQEAKMEVRLLHLLFRETYPNWLLEITDIEELKKVVSEWIRYTISWASTRGVRDFNVVNEPWPDENHLYKMLGKTYVDYAFEEAFKVRNEIQETAKKEGKSIPEIRLGFSNSYIHYSRGAGTQPTREILRRLSSKNLVDYVAVHFHLEKLTNLPTAEDVISTLKSYNEDFGVDVTVDEMDVNIQSILGSQADRFTKQAEIYSIYFSAMLAAGVRSIAFWGASDPESWYESPDYYNPSIVGPQSDALLFNDKLQPKPAYFAIHNILKKMITG